MTDTDTLMDDHEIPTHEHASEVHNILSRQPFGEENDQFLQSISTEVSLQLPWTSQLRLSIRQAARMSILMQYVWNKIKDLEEGDGPLGPDEWRTDVLIQNWELTRFHIRHEDMVQTKLLQQILDRIDRLVLQDPENAERMSSPEQVVTAYETIQRERTPSTTNSIVSLHPKFSGWVAAKGPHHEARKTVLRLCKQIGTDRSKLQRVKEQLEELPAGRLGPVVIKTDFGDDVAARRGRVLLLSLLQSQGLDVKLDPLPLELWTESRVTDVAIESYLSQSSAPNANALVVYIWTRRRIDTSQLATWLPVEPVVPLIQQLLKSPHYGDDELDQSIDFFLSLPWEKNHFQETFGRYLGPNAPHESKALKKACRKKRKESDKSFNHDGPKRMHSASHTVDNEHFQKVWGNADNFNSDNQIDATADIQDASAEMQVDSDSSDDYFDESDDRILLL